MSPACRSSALTATVIGLALGGIYNGLTFQLDFGHHALLAGEGKEEGLPTWGDARQPSIQDAASSGVWGDGSQRQFSKLGRAPDVPVPILKLGKPPPIRMFRLERVSPPLFSGYGFSAKTERGIARWNYVQEFSVAFIVKMQK